MLSLASGPAGSLSPASIEHAPAVPRPVAGGRPKVAVLAACALGFLAVAGLEAGLASSLGKVGWVMLTIVMGAIDPGTAVALYLAGVAVYSPRHFTGWGSFTERPDNYAIVGLLIAFFFSLLASRRRPRIGQAPLLAWTLLMYALTVTAVRGQLDRANFAALIRTLGVPLLLFTLLAIGKRKRSELVVPLGILVTLGVYTALVSMLEAVGAYSLIRPAWIADPSINDWLGSGRSGGLQMQPAFNGLGLTLTAILCIGFGWTGGVWRRAIGLAALLPMIAGIFVCYTRGPWLGCLLAGGVLSLAGAKRGGRTRVITRLAILLAVVVTLIHIPSRFARERAGDTGTVEFRFNLWAAALRMAAEKPLFGYGFAQFKDEVGSFREPMGEVGGRPQRMPGNVAHNHFLRVLVELGGIGLLLYGLTVWGVLMDGSRGAPLLFPGRGSVLVLALTVAYFFNGLFITLHEPFQNCLYFGPMGLLAGAARDGAGD